MTNEIALTEDAVMLLEVEVKTLSLSLKLKSRQKRLIARRARKFIERQITSYEELNKR